jgi:hypothetical protein
VDNSIRLKELQDLNGALRKRDEGLRFLFIFSKGFFWVRRGGGEDGVIPPLSKGGFLNRLG